MSHDCRATLARVYHDVRADFNQFYYLSQVKIAETKLQCVCERLRRVGDGCATLAITWRLFCDDFCRTKKSSMFKTFANSSRPVCDAIEDFALPCKGFRD